MTWTIVSIIGGMIALQSTFLLYIISSLKADINRQFDALNARIARLEERLFGTRNGS